MNLLREATNFLLYEKQCMIVTYERGLHQYLGKPDVCGVTKDRKLIEIEIKETFEDFKANFEKKIISYYKEDKKLAPHYFYFFVNENILEKVLGYTNEKHTGYGIISRDINSPFETIKSFQKATLNKEAEKLSLKEMAIMVKNQSRSYMSLWKNIEQRIESKVNEALQQ